MNFAPRRIQRSLPERPSYHVANRLFSAVMSCMIGCMMSTVSHADTIVDFEDIMPALSADSARMANQTFQSGGMTVGADPAVFAEVGPSNRTTWGPGTTTQGLYYDFNQGGGTPNRNDTAVVPGTGRNGSSTWIVANAGTPNSIFLQSPNGMFFDSLWVSNTRTVDFLVQNADPNNFSRPLNQPGDFLQVIFNDLTPGGGGGTVTFDLAGYDAAAANNVFSVSDWTRVDLSGLGQATRIGIEFDGSDVGAFGLNTPAYLGIDDVAFITAVPEPGTALFFAGICGWMVCRRKRRACDFTRCHSGIQ